MRIMQGQFLFLLIFAIILCIYPSYTTAQPAQPRTFTHVEENNDYDETIKPRMQQIKTYYDGTVVGRIVRLNRAMSAPPKTCFFDTLSLRIIHLDGTVDEKDIKLDIPQI